MEGWDSLKHCFCIDVRDLIIKGGGMGFSEARVEGWDSLKHCFCIDVRDLIIKGGGMGFSEALFVLTLEI